MEMIADFRTVDTIAGLMLGINTNRTACEVNNGSVLWAALLISLGSSTEDRRICQNRRGEAEPFPPTVEPPQTSPAKPLNPDKLKSALYRPSVRHDRSPARNPL